MRLTNSIFFKNAFFVLQFEDDGFMVVDIGDVLKKHKEWMEELPNVTPFFGKFKATS